MNVLLLGGSRNIGYETAIRLLADGDTVTFLLRRKDTFDADQNIQKYIESGHVKVSVGDALKQEDVRAVWDLASSNGTQKIDVVLFALGANAVKFSIFKGIILDPPNLVTMCLLNLLATWPKDMSPQPKLIVITANGANNRSYAALPYLYQLFYAWMLSGPQTDKLGAERSLFHAAGWTWVDKEPANHILPSNWQETLGSGGWLQEVLVVRPPVLTDGACVGDTKAKPYRTGPEDLSRAWTISRKDVAHFIATKAIPQWDSWKGQKVTIAY